MFVQIRLPLREPKPRPHGRLSGWHIRSFNSAADSCCAHSRFVEGEAECNAGDGAV